MNQPKTASLVSEAGDTVTVSGEGSTVRSFPVGVWMLTDGRRVVIVGEGGPLSTATVDGSALVAAVHARWPGAVVLERTPVTGSAADPRAYSARYVEVRDDGSHGEPAYADLSDAGFALGPSIDAS
ncbi:MULTISPECIES: hypothetical protein [Rhodococcus]|uniref:hypothetical protein n=1 Tax=Rhodococcus TaxID=1827 RepID=UPI0006BA2723|nr:MULTISPECIES: hypothetical protein [Rhodococcus]KPH20296.1 hypothetical protein AN948_07925 [Rhodococcus sp. ADH]KZF16470.1 hypothetical protein A2J01_27055 [Rhodococcus sp. EPR-134]MCQ4151046.1 hypothetical protein [Rhodococcus qingshengii]OFE07326.1 hypothetical protein A5N83_18395 [Rhodococcus sp. 1139]